MRKRYRLYKHKKFHHEFPSLAAARAYTDKFPEPMGTYKIKEISGDWRRRKVKWVW